MTADQRVERSTNPVIGPCVRRVTAQDFCKRFLLFKQLVLRDTFKHEAAQLGRRDGQEIEDRSQFVDALDRKRLDIIETRSSV